MALKVWATTGGRNPRACDNGRLGYMVWVKFLLYEFQTANFCITPPVALVCVQWEAPQPPWYKLNVDKAVFSSSYSAGVRAVIRDTELKLKRYKKVFFLLGMWVYKK